MKKNYFKLLFIFVFMLYLQPIQAQTITNVAPSIGMEGTTINVAISGQNSNFLQGTTTVWFNQGSSTIYANSVSVSNATSLLAQVGIPYGTPLGLYQTNVQDPIDNSISLPVSFAVVANPNTPSIVNVNPSTTMEGTSLAVSITGQNTNFQQGTTTVWFNQGSSTIYSSNVNVNSASSLSAFFTIPFGTPLGLYDTNVQDPVDNTITSPNSFTITANPNAPALVSITPNNGNLNTTIPVVISGQNTSFLQGTGTLFFVQGPSTLITSNIIYNSATQLAATLNIPPFAYPGYYDVYYTSAIDGTLLLASGFYVNPPPCSAIDVAIVQQPCPGGNAFINISGGFAPYSMVIDGQTIPVSNNYYDYLPPSIGNFTITSVIDNFGCPATAIDSVINNSEFSATLSGINTCVGTSISLVDSIVSSYAISNIYYNFGSGLVSSINSTTYNAPGFYYPTMEVINSNGCIIFVNASVPVLVYTPPQNSIVSLSNANCGLTNGAFEIAGVGNGPFSYNISGIGGYSSNNTINSGLAAGTYNINIVDSNGCQSNNLINIANVSNQTNISGNIQTALGVNANNTTVKLLSIADTQGAMDASYTTTADANGSYSFSNLVEGDYILLAEPDANLFPEAILTYSNGAAVWFNSDTIQVSCTSQQVVDISLLNAVQQNGSADIGGFIAEYTFNMLPNVGVVLYDDNNNITIARTSSDAAGNYNFSGVNSGHYSVFVDIPGISHLSNYTFNLNANDVFWNKSYFVDFGNRNVDTVFFIVGNKESSQVETKIFPNPFTNQTTISYTLANTSSVCIEVYNILGEKVETLVNENKSAGNHLAIFSVADKSKGVFFVKLNTGNSQKTFKIISVE